MPRRPPVRRAAASVPGLARVVAAAGWHTAGWGVRTSAETGLRIARTAAHPEEIGVLLDDAAEAAAVVAELARAVSQGVPVGQALLEAGQALGGIIEADEVERAEHAGRTVVGGSVLDERPSPETLRDRGQDLLRRSRDVWATEDGHPAYDRILSELAPDEARILVLLLQGGPQPSVDVRTGGPAGLVSSQLVAPGLTMIGGRAGCRYLNQVPSYLNNLFRLGLVWFSRESLRDPMDYQVLEAQPDVLAALHSVRFTKVVRRSIHLTPFGEDFCRTCLVEEQARHAEFPEHGTPSTDEGTPHPAGT